MTSLSCRYDRSGSPGSVPYQNGYVALPDEPECAAPEEWWDSLNYDDVDYNCSPEGCPFFTPDVAGAIDHHKMMEAEAEYYAEERGL